MGRKPIENIQYDATVMENALAVKEEEDITAQKADELYLDGREYDEIQLVYEAVSFLNLARRSIVEVGKRLIVLKAHEGHGSFGFICQKIGVDMRTAQRYMKYARVYGKYDNLSHLPMAKLAALDFFSPEQLDAIDDGDGVSGITLEGIQGMTAKELREEVERMRSDIEQHDKKLDAVEKVVRQKESKISELEMELAGKQPPTKEQLAQAALDELRVPIMRELATANESVRRCIQIVGQAQKIEGVNVNQLMDFSEQCSDLFSLLDDNYQDFCQDMEYIRPDRQEE